VVDDFARGACSSRGLGFGRPFRLVHHIEYVECTSPERIGWRGSGVDRLQFRLVGAGHREW
jgi:hypothetical protein